MSEQIDKPEVHQPEVQKPVVDKPALTSKSEVRLAMERIDAEYDSAMLGMHGFAQGTTRHTFINQKMENMANELIKLGGSLGDDAVIEALIEWQDGLARQGIHPPA